MQNKTNYDFIIVGGGSAGCVLANRLSTADPNHKVLVLEAGREDHRWDFRIQMPAALTHPLTSKFYNWGYESEPEPQMHNRRIAQPRGKVLGGSSTINGMIFIRGNPLDYEKWKKITGFENWDFAHCLPYFKKFENKLSGGDEFRSKGGPLHLTTPSCDNPLFDTFFKAAKEAGYPIVDDINGYQQEGFSKFDATLYKGRRWNAAKAYYDPIKENKNLKLILKAHASKILFEGKKAVGVEYQQGSETFKVYGKEIICCGGAINSPQLLQLSGIGNPDHLQSHGISVKQDLKGVGENLQDHLELYVQYSCKKPISLNPALKFWRAPKIGAQWLFGRSGIGATNHFSAGGFIRSNDQVEYPNIQFHFLPLAVRYDGSSPKSGHGFQLHVGPMNTDVRGHVRIKSKNHKENPSIFFNYLSTEQEKKDWIDAIRCSRKIIGAKAFDDLRGEELAPGANIQTDEEILDFVGREGESAYHPSCTCKMGEDSMSVVDSQLRVHGVQNLRVVDASVMPSITNGNIYAPVLMVAEKSADIILGNTPLEPLYQKFYKKPEETTACQ